MVGTGDGEPEVLGDSVQLGDSVVEGDCVGVGVLTWDFDCVNEGDVERDWVSEGLPEPVMLGLCVELGDGVCDFVLVALSV